MWVIIGFVALTWLAVAGGMESFLAGGRRYLAEMVTRKMDLPEDAVDWMIPGYRRPEGSLWDWVSLIFLATAIVAGAVLGPWYLGVVGALGAFILGLAVGSQLTKLRGNICPLLLQFAINVQQRAERLAADGDTSRASAAQLLAARLEELCTNVSYLTQTRFERYYTPFQVAGILDDRFSGLADNWELAGWLEKPNEVLYDSPAEVWRVTLLNRARRALATVDDPGDCRPKTAEELEHIRQWIDELRGASSVA